MFKKMLVVCVVLTYLLTVSAGCPAPKTDKPETPTTPSTQTDPHAGHDHSHDDHGADASTTEDVT